MRALFLLPASLLFSAGCLTAAPTLDGTDPRTADGSAGVPLDGGTRARDASSGPPAPGADAEPVVEPGDAAPRADASAADGGRARDSGTVEHGDAGEGGFDAEAPDGSTRAAAPCMTRGSFGGLTMYACIPSNMGSAPAPLVIAMHGYKQGAISDPAPGQPSTPKWGLISTTQWAVLAETYKFYVVFPDTGFGAPSFDWYQSFSRRRGDFQAEGIISMVHQMEQDYMIDPNRVFVNGLSSGAFMAVVLMAEYPDVFAGGSTFEGGAYGCDQNCAALGKSGMGWTWPGNHDSSLVTNAYPTVWSDPSARKPKLLVFQGDADGAVTPENMADLVQQWAGALGISTNPANAMLGVPTTLKGHTYTVYANGSDIVLATILMHGIGHGTPVDPGSDVDQGGWDPVPSRTAMNDPNAVQDWTNTAGIYGPYYSGKFFGIIP